MERKEIRFIGFDQWGNHYRIEKFPRKELMEQLGQTHAQKMYEDTRENGARHVGYVIGHYWISVYEISPVKEWNKNN